jgi:hypothetical protein
MESFNAPFHKWEAYRWLQKGSDASESEEHIRCDT